MYHLIIVKRRPRVATPADRGLGPHPPTPVVSVTATMRVLQERSLGHCEMKMALEVNFFDATSTGLVRRRGLYLGSPIFDACAETVKRRLEHLFPTAEGGEDLEMLRKAYTRMVGWIAQGNTKKKAGSLEAAQSTERRTSNNGASPLACGRRRVSK